ncbi:sodium:proton antiporter [Alicyclobacillaceae bacterium I2511]|nr:sodium:proton antiporter [Alicyclobacillaceae bacterium I2511]
MYGTLWSLLPFFIVIPLAVFTRQVLPGLLVGLLVGAYMLHPSPMAGLDATLGYILREMAVSDNLRLIVFLYGFGAFVGLVRVTGGVRGFADWMSGRIHSVRGAFGVTWLSSFATFMAPDFRIITVAPVMKHIFDRMRVPALKVAIVIDLTSTPFVALVPVGTAFVGYMVGLIATSGRHESVAGSPYHLFLLSLPLNFFSLLMIAYGLYDTFFVKPKAIPVSPSEPEVRVNLSTESRLRLASEFGRVEASGELGVPGVSDPRRKDSDEAADDVPDPVEVLAERISPRLFNLAFPLTLLLVLTVGFTWWDGHTKSSTVLGALANANAAKAMLEALLVTLVVSVFVYSLQKQPMQRTLFGFLAGGNEMMGVIVLLTLVWAVSAVSTDLGFTPYVQRTLGGLVSPVFIAPALFVFGAAISYVIGSSFGTWGMLMPLGFSLAASTHASLPLIVGAVFASGTFGGFASPLSDNTVAMATVMKLPIMGYARYKLKPALLVAGATTVCYAAVGWLWS